jgi:hypothetical protein
MTIPKSTRKRLAGIAGLLLFSILITGCVSKSAAEAQARAAYLAGQREAIAQIKEQQAAPGSVSDTPNLPSNVTIIGPVDDPIVPWVDGLTLAKAIVTSVYNSQIDPAMIVIKRSHEEIHISPSRLLSGGDFPLQPGDVIAIQMPPQ